MQNSLCIVTELKNIYVQQQFKLIFKLALYIRVIQAINSNGRLIISLKTLKFRPFTYQSVYANI